MASLIVVDDESIVTDFLTFLLRGEGHTVHAASNGKVALELMALARPELIVTDLMMPVMSGLELARAVRQDGEFRDLPIILCSGVQAPVSVEEQHLFTAILRKPYPPATLVRFVAQLTSAVA